MPTFEAQDYEHFSFDEPLTLDDAVKKARDLRRNDSSNFYRIEHMDATGNTFIVKKVSVSSAYADFMAHVVKLLGRNVNRARR